MLRLARFLLAGWRRLRFQLWATEVRLRMRAAGGTFLLEAPGDTVLEERPTVRAYPHGQGGATFTLRLGEGVWIGRGMTIELEARSDNTLAVGSGSILLNDIRFILRGGRITLGDRCDLRDGVWMKSEGDLVIGDEVGITQNSTLHCNERIELADYVGFAERVTVLDSDHSFDGSDTYFRDQPVQVEPTTIGRNSFVAAGGVVLRGSRIGRNCVVAANSVVRGGDYPDRSVIAGMPGKVVATLGESQPD